MVDLVVFWGLFSVNPKQKIPVDGVITEGVTQVDESMITGEPLPVDKAEGDTVSSGTINGNHSFLMRAEKVGSDNLLSQISNRVNDTSRSLTAIHNVAHRLSA